MHSKMLPKIKSYLLITFLFTAFLSCNHDKTNSDCENCSENIENEDDSLALFIKNEKIETKLDTMVVVDKEFVVNKVKIQKKFGEQWDFCRCVIANDSLDKLIKNNAVLDDEFMKVFEEVDLKCKAFLVMSPNKTPEERIEHEKKIKKCLKAARK